MPIGKPPFTVSMPAPMPVPRWLLAALVAGMACLAGCQTHAKPSAPPFGSITADRVVGDILVRFGGEPVNASLDAGNLLDQAKGTIRFVVKRPLTHGVWLVTAITTAPDITMEQALATLRQLPRVQTAEPDRMLKPSRTIPTTRDMPAD